MKEVKGMKEYEIIIETINPCGGDRHSQQEIVEAKIESPEAYVKEKGRFPIIDKIENPDGGVCDGKRIIKWSMDLFYIYAAFLLLFRDRAKKSLT